MVSKLLSNLHPFWRPIIFATNRDTAWDMRHKICIREDLERWLMEAATPFNNNMEVLPGPRNHCSFPAMVAIIHGCRGYWVVLCCPLRRVQQYLKPGLLLMVYLELKWRKMVNYKKAAYMICTANEH